MRKRTQRPTTDANPEPGVSIVSFVTTSYDEPLFRSICEYVLPQSYTLSIVICDSKKARAINKAYRNKTYTPNVLSFPLTTTAGELFLNLHVADREASSFKHSIPYHRAYLLIHGLLHLCGYTHGGTMEKEERRILAHFFPHS